MEASKEIKKSNICNLVFQALESSYLFTFRNELGFIPRLLNTSTLSLSTLHVFIDIPL